MTVSGNAFAYSIDAASNRLLSVGGATSWNYSHDTHGAAPAWAPPDHGLAGGRPWQTGTVQGTIQFDIDARGLRVRKSGPQGERYYHYDPAGRLIAESTAGGIHDREYLYLDDLPVAVVADGTLYHIDPDHLGTPRLVTNGQGAAVWRWEGGEPFGAQAPEEDPNQTGSRFVLNLRFPGQYYDAETQLHYNHHRDYDPATGRYVESDPIGLAGGINTYVYVGNAPTMYTDPRGLNPTAGAGAAVGGMVGGPVGAVVGGVIGFGAGLAIGNWIFNEPEVDPIPEQKPFNPGKDPCTGKCKPCPPPIFWDAPGNRHGSTSGTHVHGIVWNQTSDCMCHPKRVSGPSFGKTK